MHRHRSFSCAFLRTVPLVLIAACAGCWKKIEYTGPRTTSATPRTTSPNAEANPSEGIQATTSPPATPTTTPVKVGTAPPNPEDDRYATPAGDKSTTPPAPPSAVEPDKSASAGEADPSTRHTDATPVSATANVAPPANAVDSRRAAWLLGSRLSLAALANDRGVAATNVPIWLEDARTAAKLLGTTVADLPEPAAAGDNALASQQVINFLVVNGQRIGRELSKQHGPEESALFEIALKSNILLLLYSPGASAGNSIAAAISQAAPQAKLPAEFWQPLVEALGKQAPQNDVRAAVRKMHIDVDRYLAERAERNGR